MSAYKVYLADLLGVVPIDKKIQINVVLQDYFTKIVAKTQPRISIALVHWIAYFAAPASHELLVYFLGTPGPSLIGGTGVTHDGETKIIGGSTVSEVYVRRSHSAKGLANLAFHECMHNKLKLSDAQLHNLPGTGLHMREVTANTPLSTDNIDKMAKALGNNVPQHAAGIREIAYGRSDPVSKWYQP